jgi:cysteine sulfinate desulfinase/cysteine desulfurase-like protein
VQTEHNAVLDPCGYLESLGFEVTYLPVQPDGLMDLDDLEKALRDDTILVSVMAANNEIGVLQPLAELGQRAEIAAFCSTAMPPRPSAKSPWMCSRCRLTCFP